MKQYYKNKLCFIFLVSLLLLTACTIRKSPQEEHHRNEKIINNSDATPDIELTPTSSVKPTLESSQNSVFNVSSQDFEQSLSCVSEISLQSNQISSQNYILPENFQYMKNNWKLVFIDDYIADKTENFHEQLASLKPIIGKLPKGAEPIRNFQITATSEDTRNTTRYTYTFYENGIEEAADCPSLNSSNHIYYTVDKDSYNSFLNSLDGVRYTNETWYPLWPMYAVAQNIIKTTYTSADGQYHLSYSSPLDTRLTYWEEILYIEPVKPDSAVTVKKDAAIDHAACITVEYSTGAIFKIWQNENHTLVTASNMDYAVLYDAEDHRTHDGFIFFINQLAQDKSIPMNT